MFGNLNLSQPNSVAVTDEDINAASLTAAKFLRNFDTDIHFQIAMMFLSLRKRDWNAEAWEKITRVFGGMWPRFSTPTFLDIANLGR